MAALKLRLKELRSKKGLTLWDIARKLSLSSTGNLEKYEKNKFKHLDAKLICSLCVILDCEISDLIYIDNNEPLVLNATIENI